MHFFTVITANYIPKARVLCETLKKHNPAAKFHLVLCDACPKEVDLKSEAFDAILSHEELIKAEDSKQWLFMHTTVELCTALKPAAALEILRKTEAEAVIYLDPDIAVFDNLEELSSLLDDYSILLTPHLTVPEEDEKAIRDNELCALRHGVFNLGFIGIKADKEGFDFLRWWEERLSTFCFDDKNIGLFTDQKWIDLVPAFFERYKVIRDPCYNVATWNINSRLLSVDQNGTYLVNGRPLKFFHFTGYDSGAHQEVLMSVAPKGSVLFELSEWYSSQLSQSGQESLSCIQPIHEFYDNGQRITKEHRIAFRSFPNLQKAFADPFSTKGGGYSRWIRHNSHKCPPREEIEKMLCIPTIRRLAFACYRLMNFCFPPASRRRVWVKRLLKSRT